MNIITHSKIERMQAVTALGDDIPTLLASVLAAKTAIAEQPDWLTAKHTAEPTPVYAAPYTYGTSNKLERLERMLEQWLSTERFMSPDNTLIYMLTDHPTATAQLSELGYTVVCQSSDITEFLKQAQQPVESDEQRHIWLTLHSEFLDSEQNNLRANLFHFANQQGKISGEALVAIEFNWHASPVRKINLVQEQNWQTLGTARQVSLANVMESLTNSHWLTNFNQSKSATNEQYRIVQHQLSMQVKQRPEAEQLPIEPVNQSNATQFTSLHSTFGELGSSALPLLLCFLHESNNLTMPLPSVDGVIQAWQDKRLIITNGL